MYERKLKYYGVYMSSDQIDAAATSLIVIVTYEEDTKSCFEQSPA